jgi:hypothetical protein
MSFKFSKIVASIFYYLTNSILALFFLIVGIFCIIAPWSTIVKEKIVNFFLGNSLAIFLFGFGFLAIGIFLFINILLRSRQPYYYTLKGNSSTAISETLFQNYLETYWKQIFPNSAVLSEVIIKKNKLQIKVDFPYLPLTEQKEFLEHVKNDIQKLLKDNFGYYQEFYLSASFQTEK